MRSTEEILRHIDELYNRALERPSMYASCPECLEEVFAWLDGLKDYIILGGNAIILDGSSYAAYLLSKGYGVAHFVTRAREGEGAAKSDETVFQELSDFWRRYLAHRKLEEQKEN